MSSGKKRVKKVYPKPVVPEDNLAHWDRCVYCGKPVDPDAPPFAADAHTRRFPVCSQRCKEGTEAYVRADRKYKKVLYIVLFLCALSVLLASMFSPDGIAMSVPILPAGIVFLLFPYPITTFETFQSCPIRRVILLSRILGVVLIVLSAVFFAAHLAA